MKKIIILTIIVTGSILFISSCSEDFLDTQPKGVAGGDVMTTPEGVEALLIGAYDYLDGGSWRAPCATNWVFGSIASDDCHKGESRGHPEPLVQIERYEVLATNMDVEAEWLAWYDAVSRTNDVLNFLRDAQAKGSKISDARATEIEAEARFLRAWYHFELTRVFDNIPYIKTEEEMDGKKAEEIPNDSPGWDGIEADLQFAIDNLATTPPKGEVGRADKYAAMAVKARVHLFQQEFDQAKTLLDAIINSGEFELVDNYEDNFRAFTENNKESVFEVQCNVGGGSYGGSLVVTGTTAHQRGPVGRGWGFYQPSQSLFNAYQVDADGLPILNDADRVDLVNDYGIESANEFIPTDHLLDPRIDWTIARRGIPFLDFGLIYEGKSWIREQESEGPFMTLKYHHYLEDDEAGYVYPTGIARNAKNYRPYRYGHILLWRAEVAVEDGDLDYARQLVNMIRQRASDDFVMGLCTTYQFDGRDVVVDWNQPAANYLLGTYPAGHAAFSSQGEARKAVRFEQRLEFATEGLRFYDLRRWGTADEKLNYYLQHPEEIRIHSLLSGANYDPVRDDYMPIPQSQLDIQNVLTQDPGYE
jgi:hypothetical protein